MTMKTTKRTPGELLAILEREADDDEMERVLSLDPAARARELEAAGADRGKLHAEADAAHDALHAAGENAAATGPAPGASGARVFRLSPRRRVALIAAAAVAAAVPVAFAVHFPPEPTPVSAPRPEETPADLRRTALDACDRQKWQACLADLDIARAQDPRGDDVPEVHRARQRAIDALAASAGDGGARRTVE
jgi:hypothetical protein